MSSGGGIPDRVGDFVDACIERPDDARRMLAADPSLLQSRWAGDPLLHWFVIEDFQAAAELVIDLGLPVDLRDDSDRTPLHYACSLGWFGAARLLLRRGADPNAANDHLNENPLDLAVTSKNTAVIALLFAAGARADYVLPGHLTVIHAMRDWEPTQRAALLDDLRSRGVTRESIFAKLADCGYDSPEQAFGW